jgi:hypothetical protein
MDLYDPFGFWGGQQDQQPQQQPLQIPGQRQVPLLQPEEEDSLLSKVTGNALGGLGYVGGTLGKLFGGRAIRGALGGNARELLSVIPGSDTFGITDQTQEVHGEDLLKQWGLLEGEGQKGSFELRDLAGPALEAALDPGTYLTLGAGALTEAGKAAKAGGTLEKTLAGRIGAGQGGLAGLHVPFTDLGVTLGTGDTAQAVARGLGSATDYLTTGNPVGRTLGALFDKNVSLGGKPAMTEAVQKGVRAINEEIPGAKAAAGKRVLDTAEQLQDLGGLTPTNAEVRNYLEGTGQANPAQQMAGDSLRQFMDEQRKAGLGLGRDIGYHEGYFPRQLTPAGDEETLNALGRGKLGDTLSTNQLGREEIFDLPGKTDFVNQMSVNKNVSGPDRLIKSPSGLAEADYIRSQIPGFDAQELKDLRDLRAGNPAKTASNFLTPQQIADLRDPSSTAGWMNRLSPEQLSDMRELAHPTFKPVEANRTLQGQADIARQAKVDRLAELENIQKRTEGLADWVGKLSGKRATENLPVFGNNAIQDAYSYARSEAESNVKTKGLLKIVSDTAMPATEAGAGSVPLADVVKGMGLTEQAHGPLSDMLAKSSNQKIADFLGQGGDMFGLHVDRKIADDLLRVKQGFTEPEALKPVLSALDSFTNLFRVGTTLWPANKVRNLVQGAWSMFVGGHADPRFTGPQAYLQPMVDSVNLFRKGGTVEGLAEAPYFAGRGLTDEMASRELAKYAFAADAAGPGRLVRDTDVVGQGMHAAQKNLQLPGDMQPTLGQIAKSAVPKTVEEAFPTSISGFGGKTETKFAPAVAGRQLDNLIDDATRGGSLIALVRQGYTPEAAVLEVNKLHYDFSNMSPFEKTVMRRVMPFYSWQRQNIPAILRQITENPGGPTAMAAKLTASSRHEQGFLPDYVGETAALPIGQEENGTRTFLSHTGLPFEDLNDLGAGGAHPIQRTAQNLMAQTNPLIKGPLEAITGMQFKSGRELSDLYSRTDSPMLDQLLMNTPGSRIISSLGTLTDPRKSWASAATNLLSPARLSDIDLAKAREKAGRDMVEETLKQNPNVRQFETLSVPSQLLGQLSPEEFKMLQLYKTMEAAKKKKQPANIGIAP